MSTRHGQRRTGRGHHDAISLRKEINSFIWLNTMVTVGLWAMFAMGIAVGKSL